MFEFLILVVSIVIVVVIYKKFYVVKSDTITAFTGGLGSGKTLNGVKRARKLYFSNVAKVKNYNLKEFIKSKFIKGYNRKRLDLPEFYSNIPIQLKKGVWAKELSEDMLLLKQRLKPLSVVFIDELSSFINQFEYKNPNCKTLDEFIRLFRHYTGINGCGAGYLVVTDQNSNMFEIHIRYRVNTVFNLMHFTKHFKYFYTVKVRNISLTEDIKTIEKNNAEDNCSTLFGIMPLTKLYDTYCYSGRYESVPYLDVKEFSKFKTNRLLRCPQDKVEPLTKNED